MSDRLREPVRVMDDVRRLGEGTAVRFSVTVDGVDRGAFAVRWKGGVYAYLNTCRHQSLELDFGDAHYFDEASDALVCCHHGARYRPDSGLCFEGPCRGSRLTGLELEEREGALWCVGLGRT